jgi:sugar lactone lactonase YvrE
MRKFAFLGRRGRGSLTTVASVTAPATQKEELMSARTLLALVGASILVLAAPASAVEVETIAEGLDNPRHLAFGGGDLYVAEAGSGGEGPCVPSPAGPDAPDVCVGDTGAVTVVDEHGHRRIVQGLASFADEVTGAAAFGPHGIYLEAKHVKGKHHVLITNGGPSNLNRDTLAAQNPVAHLFGRVLKIRRHGRIVSLVDVWDFERDENPDGGEVDSNPVDVLADRGHLVIADAGGNTLLKASRDGAVEALSVFPDRLVDDPFAPGEETPMQTVPTGVVKGPDGDLFMSQLTGFPFPVGAANVYRVDSETGAAEVFADGFTNIMDLAFDKDGTLWVLEIDHDGLLGPSSEGAIYSVDENGNEEQLKLDPGTLTHPGGITVGKDGALYVTNNADAAGEGEVLRIDVDEDGKKAGEDDDGDDDDEDDDDDDT